MQAASIGRLAKTASARPALVAAGLASDRATVAAATYELMTTDLRPELGRITAPVKVIYAYDAIYGVPAQSIDDLFRTAYAGLATAGFDRVDGAFHFVMLDQPQAFAALVRSALDKGE